MVFSQRLLKHAVAKNPAAMERITLGKTRIQSVLDREKVSNQKTLEQKISEQGPKGQHVDPHLVGLAAMDLIELKRLKISHHPTTGTIPWYSNILTPQEIIDARLAELAPLYNSVSTGNFSNLAGDALELIVFKCLEEIRLNNPRYSYQGAFHLDLPKDEHERYKKTQPPKHIGQFKIAKEADFLQYGHEAGPICIECKNYRNWLYPNEGYIRELIIKADGLNAIPLLVGRRFHYTAIANFLEPAGIAFHEAYFQYYPADKEDLAKKVSNKNSLGFTDVTASEIPHPRTMHFFQRMMPTLIEETSRRWQKNRPALIDYANGELNLPQLYTAIGSPAGGKWVDNIDWGIRPEDI